MTRQTLIHFYPERISWIGAGILGIGFFLVLPCLWILRPSGSPEVVSREIKEIEGWRRPLEFSFDLKDGMPGISVPAVQDLMSFSFDPPRPDTGIPEGRRLLVRIKRGGDSKRIVLPARVHLEYRGDQLVFADSESLFWIDLSLNGNDQIEARVSICGLDGKRVSSGIFSVFAEDSPLLGAEEFSEGSPFRCLAEAKWWGKDQFRGPLLSGERLEVGSDILEIRSGHWLVWRGKWEKTDAIEKDLPIARLQTSSSKALVLEGWGAEGHVRIALPLATPPPFKLKGEDLLTSIRIRSEKQISCMLEKQCMVVKTGDWVLKSGGRWKILRKKDERDAFLNGKLFGELFILEQIFQKQGQKMIQGRLFNAGRTQVVPIEIAAHSHRKAGGKSANRGKIP